MYTEWKLHEVPDAWEIEAERERIRDLVNRDRSILTATYNVRSFFGDTGGNKLLHMVMDTNFVPHDDNIYRVRISGRKANVVCLGLGSVDVPSTGDYYMSRLPKWIQRKLAVLLMLDSVPPNCAVDGVGIRIDADTFWIFKDG